jgi:carbon monoxide dehydrogenase subunit G
MLRNILIAVAAIVAVVVAVIAVQPSQFRVERTIVIAAPTEVVFAQVNDLRKWQDWSPWAQLDSAAKATFEGPDTGVGAIFNWSGNDEIGEGRMTIVESVPNEIVRAKIDFVRPFTGTSTTEIDLTPAVDHTAVTWIMTSQLDFISKAMCLIMNPSAKIEADMDKGLEKMKALIEAPREAENPV